MRISDWSSDVCSSDLATDDAQGLSGLGPGRWTGEELLDVLHGLADPVLVLDQRDAHIALAVLAEAAAGRDRHLRVLSEKFGDLQAAQPADRLRTRRHGEHGSGWPGDPHPTAVERPRARLGTDGSRQ